MAGAITYPQRKIGYYAHCTGAGGSIWSHGTVQSQFGQRLDRGDHGVEPVEQEFVSARASGLDGLRTMGFGAVVEERT